MSLFIISWFDTTISGLAVIIACPPSSLYVASINIDSHAVPAAITPAVVDGHIVGS